MAALFLPPPARADFQLPDLISARSISGQFAVIKAQQVSPLANLPEVRTNTSLVHLEPALLAVSAERIRNSLWRTLGIDGMIPGGQIFLALHPASSLDETVTVYSQPFNHAWMYRVELPDIVSRARLIKALTGVVLLEYANRNSGGHSAEVPVWLLEGLSQQLRENIEPEIVSLSPDDTVNGYQEGRLVLNDVALNDLEPARKILQNATPLTFDQLSWPTPAELNGADGGAYGASAQVLLNDLMQLPDGKASLRRMLQILPHYYNWQMAFRAAFQNDFPTPVDMEKWWALESVDFVSRDVGPQWTPEVSRAKLDGILSVPINFRSASNSFPVHGDISLQMLIGNFDSQQETEILRQKVRDLDLSQLQMAPAFAGLNRAYRQTLADYLDEQPTASATRWIKRPPTRPSPRKIVSRLDALDARRRVLETALDGASQPALTERSPRL
ncbi:MAG: hypothetical protein ACLQSR_11240 [Limisphaerales bacterium]